MGAGGVNALFDRAEAGGEDGGFDMKDALRGALTAFEEGGVPGDQDFGFGPEGGQGFGFPAGEIGRASGRERV